MPTMANITVKNKAGTDVVYVAKVPSAGDRSPSRWQLDAASDIPSFRPDFTVGTKDSGNGRRRIADVNYSFPAVIQINGVDTLVDKVTFQGAFGLPKGIADTITEEGVTQLGNLLVSVLVRDILKTGYAAS